MEEYVAIGESYEKGPRTGPAVLSTLKRPPGQHFRSILHCRRAAVLTACSPYGYKEFKVSWWRALYVYYESTGGTSDSIVRALLFTVYVPSRKLKSFRCCPQAPAAPAAALKRQLFTMLFNLLMCRACHMSLCSLYACVFLCLGHVPLKDVDSREYSNSSFHTFLCKDSLLYS